MKTATRRVVRLGMHLALLALATGGLPALAQKYPSRPITIISPIASGAVVENAMRAWMACAASDKLAGQPFVLMAKPGGNGVIAANAFRQAPADGYTFMVAGMSQTTITPFIFKKQPFDPEKDFHGAAMFATSPLMLVANVQSGIKTLKDLEAYAKARPEGLDIGIPGIATPAHLLSAALSEKLGIRSTLVPVSGEAGGAIALMGGQIPVMVFLAGSAAPHIESGRLVGVTTFTEQRIARLPNVPTIVEELHDPSLARISWIGLTAKAGTPPEAIDAVEAWTKACLETPQFKQALNTALFTPNFVPQASFPAIVRRDIAFWKPWITRLNISND